MEQKETSGRGGPRQGAGRKKGSTKEETKKLCSYRLSAEEKSAVNSLLKEMRTISKAKK